MSDETASNASVIEEVVVNANLTTQQDTEQVRTEVNSNNSSGNDVMAQIKRLESDLKNLKNHMNCMIHGEFDVIKHYIDRTLTRDRLTKRP